MWTIPKLKARSFGFFLGVSWAPSGSGIVEGIVECRLAVAGQRDLSNLILALPNPGCYQTTTPTPAGCHLFVFHASAKQALTGNVASPKSKIWKNVLVPVQY
jgi:hypothetical protein